MEEETEQNLLKQQQHIHDVITDNYKYPIVPWENQQVEPDLILVWDMPRDEYIEKSSFMPVSTFVSTPDNNLQNGFKRAQKLILKEMGKKGEIGSDTIIKIRLQKSLKERRVKLKEARVMDDQCTVRPFQVECVHQKTKTLDGFTLQYNSIMYTLQRVCGFRVRPFILYDQELQNKRIFFFLTLSIQNRLKVATKYKIKKQIDYSIVDLYLNDPTGAKNRPMKIHSDHSFNKMLFIFYKRISRFFHNSDEHLGQEVIEEVPFNFSEQNRFLMQTEETMRIYDYFKQYNQPTPNKHENIYIFNYNKKRLNRGCKLLFHQNEQRRQYFDLVQYLSYYYQFQSIRAPTMYQPFLLPGKNFRGAGYFQRLKSILLYRYQTISPQGKIDLFLKMEKTKLAYMVLKSTFKLNFLEEMGFKFVSLPDQFQLKGEGRSEKIAGGVNGENVADSWRFYTLFSDMTVVRNYFGNNIGLQISFKLYMAYFFVSIVIVYFLLFIFDLLLGESFFQISIVFKLLLFIIAFSAYLTVWSNYQDNFKSNFIDDVSSQVFLSSFRGPYIRNMITDEINEYQEEGELLRVFKNTVCLIIIGVLLMLIGLIFLGFRAMLVSIYDGLAGLQVGFLSFPHLLSYSLFFVIVDLLRILATDKIITLLIKLRNPPSDQSARLMAHNFKFIYLLGIQLIAPFFFLVFEPFSGTSCYSSSCLNEIVFYIYSRYTIILGESIFRAIYLFYQKSKGTILNLLEQKLQTDSYQSKIRDMMLLATKQLQKPQHQNTNANNIIIMIGFAIYSVILPLVVLITLTNILIDSFNVRTKLLQYQRRTINKSQALLPRKEQLYFIYFVGVWVNSWIIFFSFFIIQTHFGSFIQTFISDSPTASDIFFFKLFFTVFLSALLFLIAWIAAQIALAINHNWFYNRKNMKFDQFLNQGYTLKVKTGKLIPPKIVKTIFRTFNPTRVHYETYDDANIQKVIKGIQKMFLTNLFTMPDNEQMPSATRLRD